MIRRGFTIVELVITITIMGILLTLAVVNLNSTQLGGRDAERKADAQSLALNFENYYSNVHYNEDTDTTVGYTYVGADYINDAEIKKYLPDLDMKIAHTPGKAENSPINIVAATNGAPLGGGLLPLPSKTNDVYVYQPLTADGELCEDQFSSDGECRRFNLYYFQESDSSVQVITSKHQS